MSALESPKMGSMSALCGIFPPRSDKTGHWWRKNGESEVVKSVSRPESSSRRVSNSLSDFPRFTSCPLYANDAEMTLNPGNPKSFSVLSLFRRWCSSVRTPASRGVTEFGWSYTGWMLELHRTQVAIPLSFD